MIDLWYKNAVLYCLDVGTFADGNGDGIGDFRGLADRLPYLAGIGVTCVWLLPFYPSPRRDDGYDIQDYYNVDPRYGTLGDFVDFMRQADEFGIRVIVDLVVNHTSDQHPWFQAARTDPKSSYRDWYIWSERKPADASGGVVFPGVQKTTWTFDRRARALLLPPLLRFPARSQRGEPGRTRGDRADHGLLAAARRHRVSDRRRAVHHSRTRPGWARAGPKTTAG